MIGDNQAAWWYIDRRGVDADGQQFERVARPALFDPQALCLVDQGQIAATTRSTQTKCRPRRRQRQPRTPYGVGGSGGEGEVAKVSVVFVAAA